MRWMKRKEEEKVKAEEYCWDTCKGKEVREEKEKQMEAKEKAGMKVRVRERAEEVIGEEKREKSMGDMEKYV